MMEQLDIVARVSLFIMLVGLLFYVLPKIIIPDVIKEFKKVFFGQTKKCLSKRNKTIAYDKKKQQILSNRSTFNKWA